MKWQGRCKKSDKKPLDNAPTPPGDKTTAAVEQQIEIPGIQNWGQIQLLPQNNVSL